MLQTKNLCKVYKPRKGVPVTALDNVNLKFPQKGMVFLLGKSGSGKSTLLNILGGLDKYDSGEILIHGVSSKNFNQKSFDSYRNTYLGFIFQEYNILDEFTVGANIGLAIQLQGNKPTDEQINAILKEVDLDGFGNRKPNELSGGQKQRVAIARALVKNPDIIMADEPTGALDSNTGKQVFDTLKKLSKEKLVIVVSHDREFSEQYADRIIELLDGKVISDVELDTENKNSLKDIDYNGNTINVSKDYRLTEEDRIQINRYIDTIESDLKINISNNKKRFVKTNQEKISVINGGFKLIKSKLPLKFAFKIGASSLKHKKIRLAISVILSCIAFSLFGLADTFGAYNHIDTCTNSISDSNLSYASINKQKKVGTAKNKYWSDGFTLTSEDIDSLSEKLDMDLYGVSVPVGVDLSFLNNIDTSVKLTESDFNIFVPQFNGYTEITQKSVENMGYKVLVGNLPNGNKNEIAISEYIFEIFKRSGYVNFSDNGFPEKPIKINNHKDILGKILKINNTDYTVTAVIDTGFDFERYLPLIKKKEHITNAENIKNYALYSEFGSAIHYSLTSSLMVGEGTVDRILNATPHKYNISNGYFSFNSEYGFDIDSRYISSLENMKDADIVWLDGKKDKLKDGEIIVSADTVNIYNPTDTPLEDFLTRNNKVEIYGNYNIDGKSLEPKEYTVVGLINLKESDNNDLSLVITDDDMFNKFTDGARGEYMFAVGAMPKQKSDINKLVRFCYKDRSNIRYPLQSSVTFQLDTVDSMLKELSKYLLYIGIGFALFAALMLSNFIGTSIANKKQEIGILRAIGSRSNDVFRIFFSESFIIAMINFLLSLTGVGIITGLINRSIRNDLGILITVLNFSLRQIVLLLFVSILIAFVASYIPVKKIASKRPIDAIRER